MNTLSKVVISSSLVLGAALFSIGCGDGDSCCSGNSVKAKVNLLASNNFTSTNTLPANASILHVNGISSTSNSNIVKADWTAYANCTKDTVIDTASATSKDAKVDLNLKTPGQHKVCVVVTDVNGLTDEDCDCITVQELDKPTPVISPTTLKSGCPLDGSGSISHSGSNRIANYNWTLNSLSGSSFATSATTQVPAGTNKVCLTVTDSNGETNGACQDVIAHVAPTAVLNVLESTGSNPTSITEATSLSRGTSYNLSCAGSEDDCPMTEDDLSCEWQARSYFVEGENCSAGTQTDYISDCFSTVGGHSGFGEKTTTPTTHTFVQLCGADNTKYKCVEFTLTVKDNAHGTAATPVKKTFHVNP